MEILALPILVLLGAIIICVWGIINPGRICWGRTGIPVSRPALVGGLIFALVASVFLCLWLGLLDPFNDLGLHARTFVLLSLFGIMATGWLIALVTQWRDFRAAKKEREKL